MSEVEISARTLLNIKDAADEQVKQIERVLEDNEENEYVTDMMEKRLTSLRASIEIAEEAVREQTDIDEDLI